MPTLRVLGLGGFALLQDAGRPGHRHSGVRGTLRHDSGRRDGAGVAHRHAGPRDPQGQAGAYEAALKGHALHDPKQPLEVLRTIHSFDPCIACAVHLVDEHGTAFEVTAV